LPEGRAGRGGAELTGAQAELCEARVARAAVRELLRDASARLHGAGCDTPSLDAELLLAHVLETSRERLLVDPPKAPSAAEVARFEGLVARRLRREPVAYILGERHFRSITLHVDSRVLIPRPETELLVEVGLALPAGARVVDVGTGSGAVALALASERADLEVWGTDVSGDALAVARGNARRLGLSVRFVQGDLLEGVPDPLDAVLANLPYVAEGAPLAAEIARYEPPRALYAGPDGLAAIRRLVPAAGARGVGLLALELDPGQARRVTQLASAAGFGSAEVIRDLAGAERIVVLRR
jgi:release factor glutamine methyltransferase